MFCGKIAGHDRLARDPHVQRGHVALRIEARGQLALRDRVIAAVQHVFLARPDELDRRAWHLLRDGDRLAHPVVHGAAAAEPAAQEQLVDVAFRERQIGGLGSGGERGLAVLRRRPDLATLRRPARGRVHRFHRRVVLMRIRVHRLDPARTRQRGPRATSPDLVAHGRLAGVEPDLHHLGELGARRRRIGAVVPFDRQRIERALRMPPGIGDHRDRGIAHADHLLHARALHRRRRIHALHLAAEHRAVLDRGIEHSGELQVHPVDLRARDLVGRVQPRQPLAGELPVLRVLERHVGRRRRLSPPRRRPCRTSCCVPKAYA